MEITRESGFLRRLTLAAASTLETDGLMRLVIARTTEAMGTQVCSVYLVEEDGRHLRLTATNGLSQEAVGRARLAVGEGVTGWAAADMRPVVVPDVRLEPRFRWIPGVDQARFVSMCSVPMISADRLVGVLNVQTERRRRFTDLEIAFLAEMATQLAGIVERSERHRRLEGDLADLRRAEELGRRLGELALAGAGPGPLCAALAPHVGAPVGLYDASGWPIVLGGPGLPAILPEPLAGVGDPQAATVLAVRTGPELLGWLVAGVARGAVGPHRLRALERGIPLIALALLRRRHGEADLSAPPPAQCAACWGQRRIWEPGPLGLMPIVCEDCGGTGRAAA
jgi:putative methionine-R-sulfoxide reductase with GAF domain